MEKRKKVVIFTGAGISQQSGIPTFRCPKEGIYKDADIEKMVHADTLKDEPKLVYDFCNTFRANIIDKRPNTAHKLIADLEKFFDVTVITTNIDSLHEKAGSSTVLHLHGELDKSRTMGNPATLYTVNGDLNVGDADGNGNELRPHVVLFGEYPYNVNESYEALDEADILIIVGNSLSIGYTVPMLSSVKPDTKVYYVDPNPSKDLEWYGIMPTYVRVDAVKGVKRVFNILTKE